MPVKIPTPTKQLALQKLRDGLSPKEVADLTGVSVTSLKSWRAKMGIGAGNSGQIPPVTPAAKDTEEKTTLDFEESPSPVEKKTIVDSAFSSLKGMLGISDEKKPSPIITAKLDAKRQAFVDAATPTLSLAAIALATYMWGRIGPEYGALAPDEKVSQRIVEPLLRVYARHASFLTDINPDIADIGASMFALVGYVHVSMGMYQHIKKEVEDNEQESNNPRNHTNPTRHESGTSNPDDRPTPIQRRRRTDDSVNGGDGGYTNDVNSTHLPEKEWRQYQALSRLSQLDFEHRARRSNRVG